MDDFLIRLSAAEKRDESRMFEKYKIIGPISSGSFSKVYRGIRKVDNNHVAIKIFKPQAIDTFHSEYVAYKTLWTDVEAENYVIKLYETISVQKQVWMVLELGKLSLRGRMKNLRNMHSMCIISHQLVKGLRFLQTMSIVHRDLKPENILVFAKDVLKICDFGLARICSIDERLHTLCGSPYYMPPELYVRNKTGYKGLPVDVWSVGAILYEVFHRKPAFTSTGIRELSFKIRKCNFEPMNRNIPIPFRRFIRLCLQKSPDARPSSGEIKIH